MPTSRISRFILSTAEFFTFCALSGLMLFGAVDMARGLHQYVTLTRIAEAGATYASLMPNLERGSFLASVSTNPKNHVLLQNELFDALSKLGFDTGSTKVSTENMNDNQVRIEITSVYTPRFGLFNPIPLSVSFSGPYRKGKGIEI